MPLASPTEGLRLADGRTVLPNGKIIAANGKLEDDEEGEAEDDLVEVPSHTEARELVVATRRKLADLPALPRTMNAISAVLAYTLFGLSDDEIALATNMTLEQVSRVRAQEAYTSMKQGVVDSILQADSDNVRELIAQQAQTAVGVMSKALRGKKVGNTQLAAAKDFLDRGGHRPVDVVEHRHKMDGGLVIEIVRKDQTQQPVTIDMEPVL